MSKLAVGSRVVITNQDNAPGVVKFLGTTQFAQGIWVGVALDKPVGKNDGSVKDTQYFECPPGHGIFVRAQVCALEESVGASLADNPKRAEARKQLSLACEEHDLEEISRMIDEAAELGLTTPDLEGAQRILMSDVQHIMIMEINEVREAVDSLVEKVTQAQKVSAESAEKAATKPTAKKEGGRIPDAWLDEVGKIIVKKISEECKRCVEEVVDDVVDESTALQELAAVADKLGQQRTGGKS